MCALTGCSTLPPQQARQASHALLDTAQTRLGLAVAPDLANHPGLSGFIPMSTGPDALVARFALARAADRTLDVQYYDFHADAIGAALLSELITAADRGVRVRLLLDDLHTKGKDEILAAVDSHPNLEVRLFNPFVHRHARWIDFLGGYARVNRRMHNKSMTADSQVSIVGGRNIGDEYFAAPAALEFSDFDVVAFGPAVAEVSAEFDDYWNSDVVYPIAALLGAHSATHMDLAEVRQQLGQRMQALRSTPYANALTSTDLARSLTQKDVGVYFGRSTLIADRPAKVTLPPEDSSTHAMPKLRERLGQAREELILVSPYFIPGKSGTRWLQDMAARGVKVRVLTNSYAAMDVPGIMAAYSAYREELLRSGVELYELKASLVHGLEAEADEDSSTSPKSSLHAKSYMADARTIFVGSMNLDPRSVALNTEMGLVIESETLGSHIRERLMTQLPEIAYHLELDTRADPKGRLVWVTQVHGQDTRYESEPGMSLWDSFLRTLQRALPIENQL